VIYPLRWLLQPRGPKLLLFVGMLEQTKHAALVKKMMVIQVMVEQGRARCYQAVHTVVTRRFARLEPCTPGTARTRRDVGGALMK